jgi:hypothetical protein
MKKKANNRHDKRTGCYVPVDGKSGSEFEESCTIDISQGGLGLVSSRRVFVDDKITVALQLDSKKDPVLTVGQVRWVKKMPDSQGYRVGMQLLDERETLNSIEDF